MTRSGIRSVLIPIGADPAGLACKAGGTGLAKPCAGRCTAHTVGAMPRETIAVAAASATLCTSAGAGAIAATPLAVIEIVHAGCNKTVGRLGGSRTATCGDATRGPPWSNSALARDTASSRPTHTAAISITCIFGDIGAEKALVCDDCIVKRPACSLFVATGIGLFAL